MFCMRQPSCAQLQVAMAAGACEITYHGCSAGPYCPTSTCCACCSPQALAERGAQLVQVHVSRPLELGQPIITIADAIAAGSYWDVPDLQQASGGRDDSSGSISAPSASKASWGEAMAGRPGTGAPLSGGIYLQRQGQQQGGGPGQARLVQAVVRQAGDMHAAMAGSTYRLEAQRWGPGCFHGFDAAVRRCICCTWMRC